MLKKFQTPFRRFKPSCFAILLTSLLFPIVSEGEDTTNVRVEYERGKMHHVIAQYEHSGIVIVDKAGQEEEVKTLPLNVKANVEFHQRYTGKSNDLAAIRNYGKAKANIKIDTGQTDRELSESNQLIVARIQKDSSLHMASISDVLRQSELDLIRNPADPLSMVELFTKSNVKVGDSWKPKSSAVANFLAIDYVYENNVKLTLKSVDGDIAKIYFVGTIKGEVDDVTTDIELSGISLVNLKQKFVTAIRSTIQEDRGPGQIAPGFQGKTKIDLKMSTTKFVKELSNDALARTNQKKIERKLKWANEQVRVTYDPAWRVIATDSDAAVLRYLDQGELIAQCNIVQLPNRPVDKPLLLKDFKSEVRKIVQQDKSASVIKAQELKTGRDLRALRVVVEGVESSVPITWIYYHLGSEDGRCLTYVFTYETKVGSRFAIADKSMVNSTWFKPNTRSAAGSQKNRAAAKSSAKTKR